MLALFHGCFSRFLNCANGTKLCKASLKVITLGVLPIFIQAITTKQSQALVINPFQATGLFWYPLKTSENQRFSDVFRGFRKRPVAWNGLIKRIVINLFIKKCCKILIFDRCIQVIVFLRGRYFEKLLLAITFFTL